MKHLSQWQQDFTESLFTDLSSSLQASFQTMSETAQQQRFAIYKNNVFYSLSNALGDLYPVVKRLVGDDFFAGTAAYYLQQHPPQQAAMVSFGQEFPEFLQDFEHTQTMPYLSHVAQLELYWHQAYHAKDEIALHKEDFSNMNPEDLATATITFHPSLSILSSDYPIFSIWQTNQEDNENQENIHLNERQQVLVVRPYDEVVLYKIDNGIYTFIDRLRKRASFEEAIEDTITEDNQFDTSAGIRFLIQEHLLTNILYNNS